MTDKTFKDYLTEMHSCGCDDNCSCGGNCTPGCNCHSECVAIVVSEDTVNEAVDQELMDQVIVQIKRDCDMGDYTAIEELLMSCPEDKLRGFLSEVDESADLNELKKLAGLPQLPKIPPSGFPSAEDSVRDMLKGIKGAPKPGTPEHERMVQQLTDPSLGRGLDPEKGFAKGIDLPPGPVPMPDPTEKPQARFPDGTPLPSGTPMPDNLPDIPKDAYRDLFKKPMKVPPMSNDLSILRRRAGIK